MSSITTTTCDGCGNESTDSQGKQNSSWYMFQKTGHYCETCWRRMQSALEFDSAPFDQLVDLENRLAAAEAQCLNTESRERELKNVRDTLKTYIDARAQDIEKITRLETDLSDALDATEWANQVLTEFVNMLGKKRRKKNKKRLTEIMHEIEETPCLQRPYFKPDQTLSSSAENGMEMRMHAEHWPSKEDES